MFDKHMRDFLVTSLGHPPGSTARSTFGMPERAWAGGEGEHWSWWCGNRSAGLTAHLELMRTPFRVSVTNPAIVHAR